MFCLAQTERRTEPVLTCCDGYEMRSETPLSCVPVCDNGCGNGVCVRTNVCRCADDTEASDCNKSNDRLFIFVVVAVGTRREQETRRVPFMTVFFGSGKNYSFFFSWRNEPDTTTSGMTIVTLSGFFGLAL